MTPEKSAELSRPIISKATADPKAKPAKANAKTIGQTPEAVSSQPGVASPQLGVAPSSPAGASPSPSPSGGTLGLDANGTDTALSAATAAVSREASGIAGGVVQSGTVYGKSDGQTITETSPDGLSRKVRIVAPTL